MPYIPYIYPNDYKFEDEHWKQAVDAIDPSGATALSRGAADAPITVEIDALRAEAAYRYCLGYSWADLETPFQLHRKLPIRHPWVPGARASAASFAFSNPLAKATDTTWVNALDVSEPITRYARWTKCLMTVHFTMRLDRLFNDGDVSHEWERYVEWTSRPVLDTLVSNQPSSFLKFAEGPLVGTAQADVQVGVPELIPGLLLKLRWKEVPADYVSSPYEDLPRVRKAAGKVNLTMWPPTGGYRRSTLLADPPEWEKYNVPLRSLNGEEVSYYDISLSLLHRDPDPGVSGTPLDYGHQMMIVDSGSNGGKWYTVTRDGTTGGPKRFLTYEIADIFKHVLDGP